MPGTNGHDHRPTSPESAAAQVLRLHARLAERLATMRAELVRDVEKRSELILAKVPERQRDQARRIVANELATYEPATLTVAAPPRKVG